MTRSNHHAVTVFFPHRSEFANCCTVSFRAGARPDTCKKAETEKTSATRSRARRLIRKKALRWPAAETTPLPSIPGPPKAEVERPVL